MDFASTGPLGIANSYPTHASKSMGPNSHFQHWMCLLVRLVPHMFIECCRAKKGTTWNLISKMLRACNWIITAVINIFQLATSYFTQLMYWLASHFWNNHAGRQPVFIEKRSLCSRRVKLLACNNQRKIIRQLLKLLQLRLELSREFLKTSSGEASSLRK